MKEPCGGCDFSTEATIETAPFACIVVEMTPEVADNERRCCETSAQLRCSECGVMCLISAAMGGRGLVHGRSGTRTNYLRQCLDKYLSISVAQSQIQINTLTQTYAPTPVLAQVTCSLRVYYKLRYRRRHTRTHTERRTKTFFQIDL